MRIYLIGIGMGSEENMTVEAKAVIAKADVIIGASRMTAPYEAGKVVFHSYKSEEIVGFIKNQAKDKQIAILLSGDVGFYSGAKKLLELLDEEVKVIPGISSVVYLCSKLHTSWQDVKLLSLHGTNQNLIGYIKRFPKVFALLSGKEQLYSIAKKCETYHLEQVMVHIGQRLSYADEKIFSGSISEVLNMEFEDLSVVLFENPYYKDNSLGYIEDEAFIRGEVPMTKSEVRSLSLSKLCLKPDSILYDIGAGTGSVSIEAADKLIDGKVYAIERHQKAVELMAQNKIKFAADNMEIVQGLAPEALTELPAPTHVFIGGSGGNMEAIIEKVRAKNEKVCVVINAIALNTVGEVVELLNKHGWQADIVSVSVAKNKKVGNYQMMMGLNPVYIITIKF